MFGVEVLIASFDEAWWNVPDMSVPAEMVYAVFEDDCYCYGEYLVIRINIGVPSGLSMLNYNVLTMARMTQKSAQSKHFLIWTRTYNRKPTHRTEVDMNIALKTVTA